EYGDQLPHLPIAKEWKRRKLRAGEMYLDDRAGPDIDNQVGAIAVLVILRVIQMNLAGEVILFGEVPLHDRHSRINSFLGIRLPGFERSARSGRPEGMRRTQEGICLVRFWSLNFYTAQL